MPTKEFIGTCVDNPFERIEELVRIVENGKPITKHKFLDTCIIHSDTLKLMRAYPHDFEYYQSLDGIYYYTWSAIEHFYQ